MENPASVENSRANLDEAPPLLEVTQNRSQLSLRSLFFLQIQAAIIMLFVVIAVGRQTTAVPVVISTFIVVTIICGIVGTCLSVHLSIRWWWLVGPVTGAFVGLIASALTLSPPNNLLRLGYAAFASSTLLIVLSCWLGRFVPQEECDWD